MKNKIKNNKLCNNCNKEVKNEGYNSLSISRNEIVTYCSKECQDKN